MQGKQKIWKHLSHVGIQMLTSEEMILYGLGVQWRPIWNAGPSHFIITKMDLSLENLQES